MLTNKQQQNAEKQFENIKNNLKTIVIHNQEKIINEVFHSPDMYRYLLESKNNKRPSFNQMQNIMYEYFYFDDNFVPNYFDILIKENISNKEIEFMSEGIGTGLAKIIKKIIKVFSKDPRPSVFTHNPIIRHPGFKPGTPGYHELGVPPRWYKKYGPGVYNPNNPNHPVYPGDTWHEIGQDTFFPPNGPGASLAMP